MATIDARAARLNLAVNAGDDLSLTFTVTESSVAYDWTGATVDAAIYPNGSTTASATTFTTATPTNGTLTAVLSDADTTTLGVAVYQYRIRVTKSGLTQTWVAGNLSISSGKPGGSTTTTATLAVGGGAVALTVVSAATTAANVTLVDSADRFAATEIETGLSEVASLWKHKQSKAFMRNLALSDRPYSVAVMGDSTGNDTTEWPHLTATWLGTKFPAYTITHRLWDDTAQGWGTLTTIQTGTAGEAYLTTDGTNNRLFSSPDSATLSPTGDISVRVKLQPTGSWTSGADSELFNKFGGAGQRSWRFYLRGADGKLTLEHTSDGSTLKVKTSTVAVPFASGEAGWIRADLDVDNGASGYDVLFYTSTDGSNWTQLGTTVTTATASSVFDSTADMNIGSRGGSGIALAGKLYACDFYSGIGANPTMLAAWRAGEMWRPQITTPVCTGYDMCGNLWSANTTAATQGITGAPVIGWRNASVSGQALAYYTNAARLAKIHTGRIRLSITSLSHNEGGTYAAGGDLYYTDMLAFIAQLVALSPSTAVVLMGQNPKASPSTADQIALHRDRVRAVAEAAAVGDHGFVDAYTAMVGNEATYVDTDGIHPTAAGSTLWAQLTERFLLNA